MVDEMGISQNRNNDKSKYFITRTAYLSVEINAHNLLYLVQLVKEKQLPKESLHTYLFNSQTCEAMFRDTRSLSGIYSTVVNFTVDDFLRRSQKLSVLNQMKASADEEKLTFPVHQKHRHDENLLSLQKIEDIDYINIEQVIKQAYHTAVDMIKPMEISNLLIKYDMFDLDQSSSYIFNHMNRTNRIFDDSGVLIRDEDDNNEEDDDDNVLESEEDESFDESSDNESDRHSIPLHEDTDSDTEKISSSRTSYSGIRLTDNVSLGSQSSYFKVKINGKTKYLHKQSASWLLTDQHNSLSAERLVRVIQAAKKDA